MYFAPPKVIINLIARADAIFASFGSTPRSNLLEASDERMWRREF